MAAVNLITNQELSPTAIDVLKRAKEIVLGDTPLNLVVNDEEASPRLVLGRASGEGDVTTLSVKQIVTKESAVTDLVAALRLVLDIPEPPVYEYRVIEKLEELDILGPVVAFDIEVAGDISTDLPWETPLISMAFYDGKKILVIPEELCEPQKGKFYPTGFIPRILRERTVIGHNTSFDMRTVSARLGQGEALYPDHDTMLMHYAMYHASKQNGLKEQAQKYFNAPEWETEAKKYTVGGAHYENIPRNLLYKYIAGDVYWTWQLYQKYHEMLENDPPRRALYLDHLIPLSHMYQDIEDGGVPVDEDYFGRLSAELEEETGYLLSTMSALVGDDKFNPNSWQQVKRFIEGSLKRTIASTDEETLTDLLDGLDEGHEVHKFVTALLDYRGKNKLRSTYAEGTLKRARNGVVFPEFTLHMTTTGRTSSLNPNVQNQPRGPVTRTGFVASGEDRVVLAVDYSQIELRTLAELCGDEAMIAAFQPGAVDYFDNMMPAAYPSKFIDVENFQLYKEAHPQEAEELRAQVKGVQYGLNYGRGVKAIAKALNLPIEDTEKLVNAIFETYPGLQVWQEKVRRAVGDPSMAYMLTTPFNRRFQSEVITSRNRHMVEKAALAFVPQSAASDITQTAALNIHRRVCKYNARIVATIHDEIKFDAPAGNIDDLLHMIRTEMVGAADAVFHRVAFEVEATTGRNWAEV